MKWEKTPFYDSELGNYIYCKKDDFDAKELKSLFKNLEKSLKKPPRNIKDYNSLVSNYCSLCWTFQRISIPNETLAKEFVRILKTYCCPSPYVVLHAAKKFEEKYKLKDTYTAFWKKEENKLNKLSLKFIKDKLNEKVEKKYFSADHDDWWLKFMWKAEYVNDHCSTKITIDRETNEIIEWLYVKKKTRKRSTKIEKKFFEYLKNSKIDADLDTLNITHNQFNEDANMNTTVFSFRHIEIDKFTKEKCDVDRNFMLFITDTEGEIIGYRKIWGEVNHVKKAPLSKFKKMAEDYVKKNKLHLHYPSLPKQVSDSAINRILKGEKQRKEVIKPRVEYETTFTPFPTGNMIEIKAERLWQLTYPIGFIILHHYYDNKGTLIKTTQSVI
ncbi:hypothetical protein ACFLZN_00380 [Nanoarchaeota archaeon]